MFYFLSLQLVLCHVVVLKVSLYISHITYGLSNSAKISFEITHFKVKTHILDKCLLFGPKLGLDLYKSYGRAAYTQYS